MDSTNPLSSLFQEIEDFLKNEEESFNHFKLLKNDYLEGNQEKNVIYDKIYTLIQSNELLTATLESVKGFFDKNPSPIDIVRDFTLFFTKNLSDSPELVKTLTHLTSLFVENFITFDFLSYYIQLTCPQDLFEPKLEELRKCLDQSQQYIYRGILPNVKVPTGSNILITGKPSVGSQFLIIISVLIKDQEQQQSILKCLKLYGLQLIPYETAYEWLSSFNDFIGQQFEVYIKTLQNHPSSFIPSSILTDLLETNSEIQLMWAFGTDFYNFLKNIPKTENNAKSAFQLNNGRLLEKNRKTDSHTSKAAVYIAELQSIKFFSTLKAGGEALRKGEQLITSIPEGVIESLFGQSSQIDKTDIFYRILFEKCYEYGEKATKMQIRLLKNKYHLLNPSTPDGRTAFHELVRPAVVLRSIVFSGCELEKPENQILGLAFEVAEKTVGHFTNLTQKYQKMVKAIKTLGQFDVDDHAVLSIYYFMFLASLIEKVDQSKFDVVKEIPKLIFEKTSPLSEFDMEEIANVDIVLKNFVQHLHRADENQFFDQTKPHFHKDFVFHLDIGKSIVISKGIMNPISYLEKE